MKLPGIAGNWQGAVGNYPEMSGTVGKLLGAVGSRQKLLGNAWGAFLSITWSTNPRYRCFWGTWVLLVCQFLLTWSAYPSQKAFKRGSVLQVNVMKRERLGWMEMSGGRCWERDVRSGDVHMVGSWGKSFEIRV